MQLQVLSSLVPGLVHATDELHNRLKNGDYGSKVFRSILDVKRRAFLTQFEAFQDPSDPSLFVDHLWVRELGVVFDADVGIPAAIIRANVAMALYVLKEPEREASDRLDLLQSLDVTFPQYFVPPGSDERHSLTALAIRTVYCIHELAFEGSKGDARAVIASIFCEESSGTDYANLFTNGPFRSLGGQPMDGTSSGSSANDEENELCAKAIQELYEMTRKRKMHGIEELMKRYPFDQLVAQLSDWLFDKYASLKDSERQDDAEDSGSDSESLGESQSQPIMRPSGNNQPQ